MELYINEDYHIVAAGRRFNCIYVSMQAFKNNWEEYHEDNTCLHCGGEDPKYCEACYQNLIAANLKLQHDYVPLKPRRADENIKKINQEITAKVDLIFIMKIKKHLPR